MYTIRCWNFSKKLNSTAVPQEAGVEYSVSLKRGCSILNPVFLLETGSFDYNYIYFHARYYWVRDIIWERDNLCSVQCGVDVLGSWSEEIKDSNAYVNYSEANFDPYLRDDRLFKSTDSSITGVTAAMPVINNQGCYLLGSIGSTQARTAGGMVNLNALTQNALNDLSVFFSTEEELISQITSQFGNAFGCICFIRWVPLNLSTSGTTVYLGKQNTGVSAGAVTQRNLNGFFTFNIPWFSNDFRRYEPYSQAYMYLPFVGVVPVSLSSLGEAESLLVNYSIDLLTGDIVYSISNAHGQQSIYSGNLASDIPLVSYQRDLKSAVVSAVNVVDSLGGIGARSLAGVFAGKSAGDAVRNGFLSGSLDYASIQPGILGGFSGNCGAMISPTPSLVIQTQNTSQNPSEMAYIAGRPCGKTMKIGNLSGYCECAAFKITGNMTEIEKRQIINYMGGGVFIE